MFKRKQTQPFEITEHPEVIAALNAMWQQAYDTGRRDAVAIARDLLDEGPSDDRLPEPGHGLGPARSWWADGISEVIERLES